MSDLRWQSGNAVPVDEATRDQWARDCMQDLRGGADRASLASGDSMVIASRNECGTVEVEDVLIRRYLLVPGLLPAQKPSFGQLVRDELENARAKHPGKQASLHEGYAVLLEEVEEFWVEVMKKAKDRNPRKVREELVQIAAMAQRTAEDLGLMDDDE